MKRIFCVIMIILLIFSAPWEKADNAFAGSFNVKTYAASPAKLSTAGQGFIKECEGYHSTAYLDSAGKWTIGWGHTAGVYSGMTITQSKAQEFFESDMASSERIVANYASDNGIVFTQQQFDALVSMIFNLGSKPLASGTRLTNAMSKYRSGSSVVIPAASVWECFATWHHVGKTDLKGLFYRRMNEAKIFAFGDYYRKMDWDIPSWLKNGQSGPEVPDGWVPVEYSGDVTPDPEPGIRSFYTPLTCYTVSTGNVTTYTSASGSTVSGYITGSTDQCVISKVYVNGKVEVTYPTPSGPKLAYAYLSDFISSSHAVTNYSYSVSANTDVYRRKDLSETIGKAYSTDSIVVVGESGGLLQIIYPISGGYKLGWISGNSSSSGDSSGSGSSYSVDSRYPTPISAYTNKSANVTTYSAVNGGSTGAIYTTDLCTISEVYTNGWCKVTYPTSSTPKTAYTEFSNFLDTGCSVTPADYKPSQTLTVYSRKDFSTTFGSVWSTDNCKTVASTGNLRQIIYPLDAGGYKMGWINLPTSTPTVNWPMPLKAYIDSATDRASIYQEINTNPGYGQIFVDDLCTINAVYENGWVNVTYPTSGDPKTGYVPLSVFVPNQVTAYSVTAPKQVISYQKSNMATQFGYADPEDNCIIVGRSGDKVQMIYPISGGYKLGWAYASDFTKTLTGLSVGTKPAKTSYVEGESFNTSGLVINASYSDNTTVSVTGYTLSGYSSTPGEKTVTVTYSEGGVTKTTAFSVTVAAKTPTKLTITKSPSKVTYLEGQDSFDFNDMAVTVTYNNGTSSAVTGYELFGMSTAAGTHPITVKYTENGVSVSGTFVITVKAKSLELIYTVFPSEELQEITVPYGDDLDLSSVVVIAEYDNGDYEEITNYTVQGFDPAKTGKQTVTISYGGVSTAVEVLVVSVTSVMTNPDMVLPEDLTVIEREAFCGCRAKWIRLSENVEEIGDRAFADSEDLEQIYIPESTVKISSTSFEGLSSSLTIYAKAGSYAEFYAKKNGFAFVAVE